MATHSSILGEDKRKRRIKFNLHFLLLPVLLKCDCRTQAFLPQPLFTGPELLFLSVAIDNYTYSGEGNGSPLQYSCLENPTDGGAWWAAVHGVAKSQTRLSDFTFTFMHWRRKWQPTPVFLPGESQGWESLVGFHLWGRTESDKTEAT